MPDLAELNIVVKDSGISQADQNLQKLERTAGRAQANLTQVGTTSATASGQLARASTSALAFNDALLAGIAGGAVVAGIGAFTTALASIPRFLSESITEFAEASRANNLLLNSLRNTGQLSAAYVDALNDQAEAQSQLTTFTDEQVQSIQRQLVLFGKTRNEVTALVPVVLDLAAATDGDLSSALLAVTKYAQGNVDAFGRLGLRFKENATEAEKLAVVAEFLARTQGAARLQADDLKGSLSNLKKEWGELKETTGKWLSDLLDLPERLGRVKSAIQDLHRASSEFDEEVRRLSGGGAGRGNPFLDRTAIENQAANNIAARRAAAADAADAEARARGLSVTASLTPQKSQQEINLEGEAAAYRHFLDQREADQADAQRKFAQEAKAQADASDRIVESLNEQALSGAQASKQMDLYAGLLAKGDISATVYDAAMNKLNDTLVAQSPYLKALIEDQDKLAEASTRTTAQLKQEAETIEAANRTPAEALALRQRRVNELVGAGALSPEIAGRELKRAQKEFEDLEAAGNQTFQSLTAATEVLGQGITRNLADAAFGAEISFKSLGQSVIKTLIEMQFQAILFGNALQDSTGGGAGKGGLFGLFKLGLGALSNLGGVSTSTQLSQASSDFGLKFSGFQRGGYAMGVDTVPAMLEPGEFVVQRRLTEEIVRAHDRRGGGSGEGLAGGRGGGRGSDAVIINNHNTFQVNTLDGRQAASVLIENRSVIEGIVNANIRTGGSIAKSTGRRR